MRFLPLFILLTTIARAQESYIVNYNSFTRSSAVYSNKDVFKMWKGDTVSLKGAFRRIVKQGNVLYLETPIGDTFLITEQKGDLVKDTMVTMAFKGGGTAFIYKGSQTPTGAIYDYWLISYPDAPIPENSPPRYWDKKSVTMTITVVIKQATYSN